MINGLGRVPSSYSTTLTLKEKKRREKVLFYLRLAETPEETVSNPYYPKFSKWIPVDDNINKF